MTIHRTVLVTASLALLLALVAPAHVARADIFQWQYINPANPSQGKQPSTMLCPGGAGANAVPAANLANRNLTKAFLIGANLSAIAIYGGELGDEIIGYDSANLTGANLSQADLTNANLTYAWLGGANLTGAEVRGANFSRSTYYAAGSGLTAAQLYSTASYQAHDLTGITLGDNNLAGVNLVGQNLTGAGFNGATLTGANLSQANLTKASFYGATLTNANLTGAEVRGAYFSNITAPQLYSTASYQAHDLTGIGLDGNLTGANFAGQNLTGATLSGTLTNAIFSQANLSNAHLNSATLTNSNLSGANLMNAELNFAALTGANLTGADVRGANFYRDSSYGTGITSAQLSSTASYHAHDLNGITLAGNDLTGVNLAGQNLTNANVAYTTLTGANLTGAEVRGANFYLSGITTAQLYSTASYQAHDLTGIGLGGNNLAGVNLAGQNLTHATFSYYTTLSGANLSQANLTNASFSYNTDLTGANLTQANLTNASLLGNTTLTSANLTGAEVRGARFCRDGYGDVGITTAQLYSTASYQAHDLTGIGLGGDLTAANFAGQNLTNAHIATFAYLSGANLSQANLTNAGFAYTTLNGANLTGAIVQGADFASDTYNYQGTYGITLAQLYSTASYQTHDLSRIALGGNNLAGANLDGQNLSTATFSNANLTGATLSQANLTNAGFSGATLTGANFTGANLTNADFSGDGYYINGADLSSANLSGADARGANFQYATLTGANTTNLIQSDGHMAGLDLTPGASLVVRDYAGDPSRGLGPIPVIVQDHVTMGNGSAITVSGATLRFALATGSPTIGTGVSAVVSSGATLELAGSVSALANGPNRVNVTNNSTAPGILVSGIHQQVGNIDGSGTTQVNAGSDLTANRIIQTALVIGGTSGSHGLVTIDASDASGNPTGQSSGFALADLLTPSGPFGAGDTSFTNLSSIAARDTDLIPLLAGNPAVSGNSLPVPEPSTLALALLAVLGVVSTQFARHQFRSQTV
jgi:uncharacterized protein YjbI with pentapeptide repeats